MTCDGNAHVGDQSQNVLRYFVSYTGVKLPLQLTGELDANGLHHRNTYFRGWFDPETRLVGLEKITYGEVELTHRYEYHDNGVLKLARIVNADDEITTMHFDIQGTLVLSETVEA